MTQCRICKKLVTPVISFGRMPIANGFLSKKEFGTEYFFELAAAFCENCKMFQLVEQPDPKKMFHENYAFFSSTSKYMERHFEKMASSYFDKFLKGKKDPFIVELGSNDGIMLKNFAQKGIRHLGVEPSANVAKVAKENGVNTICDFFGESLASEVEKKYGAADIICAANVMCHIPDLHSVAKGVNKLLKRDGIFVFEDPYLGDMVKKTSYDQLYDEHVYIFSAISVINAFKPYGLELFHVEPQETHGGSMRYYLCRKGEQNPQGSVEKQLRHEHDLNLDKVAGYLSFAEACIKNKSDLVGLLKSLKKEGKRVVGYAATSKSTTILNYCGVGPDLIEYICDTTPLKQGKYTPGMHIPVKSYQDFKSDKVDYAVLFAWNHAREILEKENGFVANGGKWIFFVPEVKIA